jgi:hypothetical protein
VLPVGWKEGDAVTSVILSVGCEEGDVVNTVAWLDLDDFGVNGPSNEEEDSRGDRSTLRYLCQFIVYIHPKISDSCLLSRSMLRFSSAYHMPLAYNCRN